MFGDSTCSTLSVVLNTQITVLKAFRWQAVSLLTDSQSVNLTTSLLGQPLSLQDTVRKQVQHLPS